MTIFIINLETRHWLWILIISIRWYCVSELSLRGKPSKVTCPVPTLSRPCLASTDFFHWSIAVRFDLFFFFFFRRTVRQRKSDTFYTWSSCARESHTIPRAALILFEYSRVSTFYFNGSPVTTRRDARETRAATNTIEIWLIAPVRMAGDKSCVSQSA